jgi:hypothetical protein
MTLVSPSQSNPGDEITAAAINGPVNQLADVINGNIDDTNISSVSGSKIANATITNAKLSTAAGELGGAWQSWTPTFVNLSGGTLTFAKYQQVGKTVRFKLKYVLGGAGVSGSVSFTLPVAPNSNIDSRIILGQGYGSTSSGAFNNLFVYTDGTTGFLFAANAAGTYLTAAALSATVPITWASGSIIAFQGSYEAA